MLSQDKLPSFIASQNTSLKTPIVSSQNMSRKCDQGVDPEFHSNPELMSTDPLTMKGFEASAEVGWPMNHVANWVSAGPSAMEAMADHWLVAGLNPDPKGYDYEPDAQLMLVPALLEVKLPHSFGVL